MKMPFGRRITSMHAVEDILRHAELRDVQLDRRLVEDAQHDAFAELRGQRRNAQIHLAATERDLDAAVLRDAALGDVQGSQHLDARDDRQRERLGRRRHFVEGTVNPVANLELVLERLEVDVARLVADGLPHDQIDEADDGRLLRHRLDVVLGQLAPSVTRPPLLISCRRSSMVSSSSP
jgi:hypothetical protein